MTPRQKTPDSANAPAGASLAAPPCSATETIRSIGRGPDGKAFVVYLRDNIRISVGRTMDTQGPAWLEITETPVVHSQNAKLTDAGTKTP
jgi:hypothetical protein